jgi:hypothetical protein
MTQDTPPSKGRVEQHTARYLADDIRHLAQRLRAYADRVAAVAADVDRVGGTGARSYADVAANVQHLVIGMVPNLGLHSLTRHAYEADQARAAGL